MGLELLDRLRHRGLGDTETVGGSCHSALFHDGKEVLPMSQ